MEELKAIKSRDPKNASNGIVAIHPDEFLAFRENLGFCNA